MSRRTPGMPILGTEKTVTAAEIAAEAGTTAGQRPKDAKRRELTPNQARLKMSDRYVGEPPERSGGIGREALRKCSGQSARQ